MEENERVITILFSSAGRSLSVSEAMFSSGWSATQVMASVRIFLLDSRYSAAFKTSEVWPEREIRTGWQGRASDRIRFGNRRMSDAGTARARRPVSAVQLAAATC